MNIQRRRELWEALRLLGYFVAAVALVFIGYGVGRAGRAYEDYLQGKQDAVKEIVVEIESGRPFLAGGKKFSPKSSTSEVIILEVCK